MCFILLVDPLGILMPFVLAAASEARKPVPPLARLKAMSLCLRSQTAAKSFNTNLQIAFDCWFNAGTSPKLRLAGVRFAIWVFQMGAEANLKAVAPLFLQGAGVWAGALCHLGRARPLASRLSLYAVRTKVFDPNAMHSAPFVVVAV